jgi:hypothetical protein
VVKYNLRVGFWIMPICTNRPNTTSISSSVTGFHALSGNLIDNSCPRRNCSAYLFLWQSCLLVLYWKTIKNVHNFCHMFWSPLRSNAAHYIVTCKVVRVTKITGSSLDDWIY